MSGQHRLRLLCVVFAALGVACQPAPDSTPAPATIPAVSVPTATSAAPRVLSEPAAYFDGLSWSADSSRFVTVLGSSWGREALVISDLDLTGLQRLAGARGIPELPPARRRLNPTPSAPPVRPGPTPGVARAPASVVNADQPADTPQGSFARPAWSPDGLQIAFGFVPDEDTAARWSLISGLYFIDPDGQNMRQILALPSFPELRDLQWSADGRQLRYITCAGGIPLRAYTVNTDGTGARMIREVSSPEGGCPEQVKWSPDGQSIAFFYLQSNPDLNVLDLQTGEVANLTADDTQVYIVGFGWSHDSRRLAYSASTADHHYSLHTVNADGSGKHLIEEGFAYFDVSWSPDGRWFLLETSAGGPPHQYVIVRTWAAVTDATR